MCAMHACVLVRSGLSLNLCIVFLFFVLGVNGPKSSASSSPASPFPFFGVSAALFLLGVTAFFLFFLGVALQAVCLLAGFF